jgi:hypothetical protein
MAAAEIVLGGRAGSALRRHDQVRRGVADRRAGDRCAGDR